MINTAATAQSYAPWENTRVSTGGISFYPMGEGSITGTGALPSAFVERNDSIMWYQYNAAHNGKKMFSDGREGWRANVNNSVLFLKQFEDLSKTDAASGEAEIEEYIATDFHEIENQGAYKSIPANDSIMYIVKWYAREIPESIDIEIGSQDLLNFTRNVIGLYNPSVGVKRISSTPTAIYPNPASSLLTIEGNTKNAQLTITDISGKTVYTKTLQSNNTTLNIQGLKKGVYIYQIKGNNINKTGKIIKVD
jgi:hypothetical protein